MNTGTAWRRVYFTGVVGTLFTDQLARGARGHVQEIDLTWPALPACNGARQHAHTRAWTWEVVFATAAKPGGGVGEFSLFDLFFLPF